VVVRCSREGELDEDNVVEMWTGRRDVKQCTWPGWPDILDARPLLVVSFVPFYTTRSGASTPSTSSFSLRPKWYEIT